MKKYDFAIIGAGASGLMAAEAALARGLSVAILEKNNEAAKKLYATGNGRCNFANADADASFYMNSGEADAYEFADAVLSEAGVDRVLSEFEAMGLVYSEEDEGRMYPRSGQAAAVVRALSRGAAGAELVTGFEVTDVTGPGPFIITAADGRSVSADKLLLAGGGKAGIQYGSDGRCLKLAESLGHKVNKPIPALAALKCAEDVSPLAGVRAQAFVSLLRTAEGRDALLAFDELGEVQFTKDALSGICVMNQARYIRLEGNARYKLMLDFLWDYDRDELTDLISERIKVMGFENCLDSLLPEKLAAYILSGAKDTEELVNRCKCLSFSITGTKGWPDAQTTCGGVEIAEINPRTMESTIVPGLFFSGEVIDIDGPCGGFNLTWAFATGLLAGESA